MRAISSFSLEAGISTFWCRALIALRIRVKISATGSGNLMRSFSSIARLLRPFLLCAEEPAATSCNCTVQGTAQPAPLPLLPRRFRNSGNLSPQRQAPETQAAQAELAQISARTSANLAAVVLARGKLWLRFFVLTRLLKLRFDLCVLNSFCCSHEILKETLSSNCETLLRPERHAEMTQQSSRLIIAAGGSHDSDVHALLFVHLGVINLGENQLIVQSQGV